MKSARPKPPVSARKPASRPRYAYAQSKDPVQVYCRVRPMQFSTDKSCMKVISDTTIAITPPESAANFRNGAQKEIQTIFTKVFKPDVSQREIFSCVALPLVDSLINGKNGLLFTYGVTGSGKTYTMTGEQQDGGIMPRCLDVLFNSITNYQAKKFVFKPDKLNGFDVQSDADAMLDRQNELHAGLATPRNSKLGKRRAAPTDSDSDSNPMMVREADESQILGVDTDNVYAVFVTYVEIYNNSVYDLLDDDDPRAKTLQSKIVREDGNKNMYVHASTEVEVKSAEEAFEVFQSGQRRRRVAHTALNAESSRSHSVFTIRLVQAPLDCDGEQVIQDKRVVRVNQLSLVDLAGSERTNRTKNTGQRLREAVIDASSKIPSGILKGNRIDLGMFDECVQIRAYEDNQEIRGRHCMYNVVASLAWLKISETLSICLPASCGPEDVTKILRDLLDSIGTIVELDISFAIGEATCSSVDPPEWTAGGIVTLVGFSLLLLFLVICTICDVFKRYSSDKELLNGRLNVLCQFSLYSNAVRVLSTKTTSATLPALQGLRFWSMCWVIWGHAHGMFMPSVNLVDVIEWLPSWGSLYAVLAPFSVDTFLALSGFLMSYVFLKEMSTGRSFNIFSYYLHRYLRLTPAFLAVILVTIFISPHLGSGPIFEISMDVEEQACRSSWWTQILYLHNYVNTENGQNCLGHTWYLAVEMQFFWISPLILYPLAKRPKIGLGILAAFFIASVATPVKIGYDHKYSTALISKGNMAQQFQGDGVMKNFYFATHIRAAPWLIGIFFGYLIFKQRGSLANKKTKWIGWLLATAAFAFCVFTMRIFEAEDYEYDEVWESIYTAVARPFWGFAVSWVMYACVRGFGGPVSKILSFSIYTPLSRISYCVYLVHYQIQYLKMRSARTISYFSTFNAFDHFLSDFMLSIMVGAVFTLVFESPVLILEKIVKKSRNPTKDDMKKVLREEEVERGITNSGLSSS